LNHKIGKPHTPGQRCAVDAGKKNTIVQSGGFFIDFVKQIMMYNSKSSDKEHCSQEKDRKRNMFFVKPLNGQNGNRDEQIKIPADNGSTFKIVDYPPVYLVPFKRHFNALFLRVKHLLRMGKIRASVSERHLYSVDT
jgi:hypothetical protein